MNDENLRDSPIKCPKCGATSENFKTTWITPRKLPPKLLPTPDEIERIREESTELELATLQGKQVVEGDGHGLGLGAQSLFVDDQGPLVQRYSTLNPVSLYPERAMALDAKMLMAAGQVPL